MKEFLFDVKLWTSLRVKANTPTEARKMLREALNGTEVNFGAWPDGTAIVAEVSTEGMGRTSHPTALRKADTPRYSVNPPPCRRSRSLQRAESGY